MATARSSWLVSRDVTSSTPFQVLCSWAPSLRRFPRRPVRVESWPRSVKSVRPVRRRRASVTLRPNRSIPWMPLVPS